MRVICGDCNLDYDDTYRLTICPHESFPMATSVYRGGELVGVATSVDQLEAMMMRPQPDRARGMRIPDYAPCDCTERPASSGDLKVGDRWICPACRRPYRLVQTGDPACWTMLGA
jgi:hypothetical protein